MSLGQGIAYAWRSLRRSPLFCASVVLTLTIGIGSAAAIFAVVNAVLIRPLPYGHANRLVGVWNDMAPISLTHAQQTLGLYKTYKRFARSLQDIALYQDGSQTVTDPDARVEPQRIPVAWVTANTIPLLEVPTVLGRPFSDAEDIPKGPNVAVIAERLWRTRFESDPSIIGKTFVVSGRSTQIIGVMPQRFNFPAAGTQIWLPLQLDLNAQYSDGFNYNAVARLNPGVDIAAAERDLAAVLPRVADVAPNMAPGVTMQMVLAQAKPVPRVISMRDDVVGQVSRTLWMVAATAILVLLVTCANVANLLVVRADGRHRELSVRAALGAGRGRVLAQFFTESAILTAISAALGIGAAMVGIHLFVTAGPGEIPRLTEVSVDAPVVVFSVGVTVVVALACSAIPAFRFMRGDPLSGLRDGGRTGTSGSGRQRARSILVAAQIALALVVLAASGLLLRSFERLRAVHPGFDATGVSTLWVSLPHQRYPTDSSIVRFSARLVEGAARLPGVVSAGLTSRLPLNPEGMNENPVYVEGETGNATQIPPLEVYATVDDGYFKTMGIPLVAGRNFDRMERQRGDEALISQETARAVFHDATGRTAVNKRFQELPHGAWQTVVGVVGSIRDTSLFAPPTRMVYKPQSLGGDTAIGHIRSTLALVARTKGDVASTTRSMQRLVRELDPTLATFNVRSMQATLDASIARLKFTMIILGVGAAVTLVLSVIGLYGVIAYVVTLRTRELGVRIALGAQPRSIAAMVARQGLQLCGAGIAAGLGLVLLASRFLRSFLFEIAPADPAALGAASAVLIAFALLASWIPARRASRVNPIAALRPD